MKNTVKFEFLSLSENEALARSVAAAFIMPLRVQCFFKPSPQQKFTYNCITYFRSFQLKPHKFWRKYLLSERTI